MQIVKIFIFKKGRRRIIYSGSITAGYSQICPIPKKMLPRIIPSKHKIQHKEQKVEGRIHGELKFGLRHLLQKSIDFTLRYHV